MSRLLTITLLCLNAIHLMAQDLPEWKRAYMPDGDAWRGTDQHFRFNNGTEPETLDPQLMTGVPESRLGSALFDGLLGLHPKTLEPVPGLAERWGVTADGLVYTFQLRTGLTWSDGVALTAATVRDSWLRVLDPATASEYAYQLFPIKGAEAIYRDGAAAETLGVTVVDATTLQVQLEKPCPWFLELVAFHTLYPVPLHVIAEHGERWIRPEHIVSSGPFLLKEWKPRQQIVMTRNPAYWDAEFVKLDTVTAYPYDELNTALQLFRDGQIDWMPGVPAEQVEQLQNDPDYFAMPYLGVYFYRFNTSAPPFDDARVRKALTMAIDRAVITDNITKAGEVPVSWWCPPMGAYEPKGGLAYDRDAARALLAETGYPGGKGFPVVEILFNTSEKHKAIAENVAQQWKESLGINAVARNSEWKTYLADLRNLDYQVARSAWIGDYFDPNTFYDCFVTDGGNNRTGWSNPEYDELLAQSQALVDMDQRIPLFDRMESILLSEDCAIAPIYNYVYQGMLTETVLGFEHNLRDHHPLQYIWLEDF